MASVVCAGRGYLIWPQHYRTLVCAVYSYVSFVLQIISIFQFHSALDLSAFLSLIRIFMRDWGIDKYLSKLSTLEL